MGEPSGERRPSRVFAGVDEAGLGPLLGPLTFGFSVFRAPAGDENLWRTLSGVVSEDPAQDRERFVVADSKRVFTRNPRGRARLEQTALGFLALLEEGRRPPRSARELLARPPELSPAPDVLERHPWYTRLAPTLPLETTRGRLELRVERLHRAMRAADVELLDAGVLAVPVEQLNRSFDRTGNKSLTVWRSAVALLRYLWENHARGELRVVVDRQGGRFRYARLLGEAFPGAELKRVREEPTLSEYRLQEECGDERRRMRVAFAERAEERSFAVALASCLAKYARETAMAAFNAYFVELQPDLRPTAGYTTDGRRWMRDALPALERAGLAREVLVRAR